MSYRRPSVIRGQPRMEEKDSDRGRVTLQQQNQVKVRHSEQARPAVPPRQVVPPSSPTHVPEATEPPGPGPASSRIRVGEACRPSALPIPATVVQGGGASAGAVVPPRPSTHTTGCSVASPATVFQKEPPSRVQSLSLQLHQGQRQQSPGTARLPSRTAINTLSLKPTFLVSSNFSS